MRATFEEGHVTNTWLVFWVSEDPITDYSKLLNLNRWICLFYRSNLVIITIQVSWPAQPTQPTNKTIPFQEYNVR